MRSIKTIWTNTSHKQPIGKQLVNISMKHKQYFEPILNKVHTMWVNKVYKGIRTNDNVMCFSVLYFNT